MPHEEPPQEDLRLFDPDQGEHEIYVPPLPPPPAAAEAAPPDEQLLLPGVKSEAIEAEQKPSEPLAREPKPHANQIHHGNQRTNRLMGVEKCKLNADNSTWEERLIGDGPPAHVAVEMRIPPFRPREITDADREAVRQAKLRVYGDPNKKPEQP